MKPNEQRGGDPSPPNSLIKLSLHCLTVNGIPLFSKNIGHSSTVPFPIIGSLNGVHMFAKSKGMESGLTRTETGVVFWKEYETVKFILLLFDNKCNERFLEMLLENIYKSLIMSIGETELTKSSNNVERLKKKMKLCSPLLDAMLDPTKIIATLTQTTETLHINNSSVLINYLTSFTEDLDSEFGCITVDGRVVVATEKFWQLQTIETSLLSYVVYHLRNVTASDTPVYLPNGSPVVPHRLITVKLIDHVQIAIVCGPEPSLQEIQNKYIVHYWSPLVPYLRECLRSLPRSFPPEIKPDHNVISVILLSVTEGKSLISFHTHGNNTAIEIDEMGSSDVRKNALLEFYLSANDFLKANEDDAEDSNDTSGSETKETYQCFTTHKCYALKSASYEIYVLFSRLVPTYSMSFLTKATLKMFTKDRS